MDNTIFGGAKPAVIQIPNEKQIEKMKLQVTGAMVVAAGPLVPDVVQEVEEINRQLSAAGVIDFTTLGVEQADWQASDVTQDDVTSQDTPSVVPNPQLRR